MSGRTVARPHRCQAAPLPGRLRPVLILTHPTHNAIGIGSFLAPQTARGFEPQIIPRHSAKKLFR